MLCLWLVLKPRGHAALHCICTGCCLCGLAACLDRHASLTFSIAPVQRLLMSLEGIIASNAGEACLSGPIHAPWAWL